MNENNDSTELKLRDAPVAQKNSDPSELKLKSKDDSLELKLGDKSQTSSIPSRKDTEVLTTFSSKSDVSRAHSSGIGNDSSLEAEGKESTVGTGKTGSSMVSTIFQIIVMIVSIAAIIVAGYFIYKTLSSDSEGKVPVVNKKESVKGAKPKQEATKEKKKASKGKQIPESQK